jgi:hypothetical protein
MKKKACGVLFSLAPRPAGRPAGLLANELCQLLDDGPQFALLND